VKKGLLPRMLPGLALVFLAACAGGSDGRQRADTSTVALGGWQRVEPGGASRCARGGRYAFWIRKGDPRRLLVFFQGGVGAASSSSKPRRTRSATIRPSTSRRAPATCTPAPGSSSTARIACNRRGMSTRGRPSRVRFASSRLDTVFVTGCSAGSVGSAFHSNAIIRRYPGARVTHVGDSLAFARDRRRPPAELGGGLGGRQGRRVSGVPRLS